METQTLSRFDRYMLSNQLRIMEVLIPTEAADLSTQREIFENGYEQLYDNGMQHISPEGETKSSTNCLEVWDTMDMFDGIGRSLSVLSENDNQVSFTKFLGYDGNSEGHFMAFAEFTVKRLGRFTYLELAEPNCWNSHRSTRPIYGRMLSDWKKLHVKDRFKMSREQLLGVLKAQIHPDNF